MTKIAFVCLGSYHIASWTKEQNFARQSAYSIALTQALFLAELEETKKKNIECDFFIAENTVSSPVQIIEELREQFAHPRIHDVLYLNNNNVGSKSKGAGEYMMCDAVIKKHKATLETYDWIIYYTLRQTIVAPILLQKITDIEAGLTPSHNTNVIVANPEYIYSNGKKVKSAPGNYCDMILAMKPKQFFDYITSMSPEELIHKKMSSETNLYNFVKEGEKRGEIVTMELERLGVMRYDYAINISQIV
jgi:hypothetical protein